MSDLDSLIFKPNKQHSRLFMELKFNLTEPRERSCLCNFLRQKKSDWIDHIPIHLLRYNKKKSGTITAK